MLSFAGRVTLARSVLNTIPNYVMQTSILPKGVCEEIEKSTRRFIWSGAESDPRKSKLSLVKWNSVTQPKALGGLGIR